MKLIDILVQELPKRGGWPDGIEEIWQDYDGLIRAGKFGWNHDRISEDHRRKHEDAHVKINKKQYEAALAANKPEWDGDGLPTVGCEVATANRDMFMVRSRVPVDGTIVKIIAHTVSVHGIPLAVYQWSNDDGELLVEATVEGLFRPIRSEADKKRNEAVEAMIKHKDDPTDVTENRYHAIFDAIAAGKIPHIRID